MGCTSLSVWPKKNEYIISPQPSSPPSPPSPLLGRAGPAHVHVRGHQRPREYCILFPSAARCSYSYWLRRLVRRFFQGTGWYRPLVKSHRVFHFSLLGVHSLGPAGGRGKEDGLRFGDLYNPLMTPRFVFVFVFVYDRTGLSFQYCSERACSFC